MDLDSYQDEIGGLSKYQVVIIASCCLIALGQAMTAQSAVYISAVPKFRCAIPAFDETSCNFTEAEIKNFTTPYDGKEHFMCTRYAYNFSTCTDNCVFSCDVDQPNVGITACDSGYVYDDDVYGETTVTQFNLVCDRRYLDTVAQTLFFFGFFVGSGAVGPLSDWFGRKKAIVTLVTGSAVSGIALAFATTYETYAFLRFLTGTFGISTIVAIYTYVCEISNTRNRTVTNMVKNFSTGSGDAIFAGLAYFIRNWHYLQIIIALLPTPMFVLYFILPESPRWLLANKRNKEARKVLERYATSKGTILTEKTWKRILETEESKLNSENAKNNDETRKLKVWDLFRRPRMRIMCFNVMLSWFTVSMVYYGLALNGENLSGEPYLNKAMNTIVELCAYFVLYLSNIFGRRALLTFSYIMAGFSCLASMLCSLYSDGVRGLLTASTVLAITGKFFASIAFALIYMVTSEIFPTNARTTGLSLGSMAARIGSMISPVILLVQFSVPWFTQTVFGALSILAGVCSLLYPETSKTEFLTSMDEAEEYYKNHANIFRFCEKRNNTAENFMSLPAKESEGNFEVCYIAHTKINKKEKL